METSQTVIAAGESRSWRLSRGASGSLPEEERNRMSRYLTPNPGRVPFTGGADALTTV